MYPELEPLRQEMVAAEIHLRNARDRYFRELANATWQREGWDIPRETKQEPHENQAGTDEAAKG